MLRAIFAAIQGIVLFGSFGSIAMDITWFIGVSGWLRIIVVPVLAIGIGVFLRGMWLVHDWIQGRPSVDSVWAWGKAQQ